MIYYNLLRHKAVKVTQLHAINTLPAYIRTSISTEFVSLVFARGSTATPSGPHAGLYTTHSTDDVMVTNNVEGK